MLLHLGTFVVGLLCGALAAIWLVTTFDAPKK
jgi:hypothetical protein